MLPGSIIRILPEDMKTGLPFTARLGIIFRELRLLTATFLEILMLMEMSTLLIWLLWLCTGLILYTIVTIPVQLTMI